MFVDKIFIGKRGSVNARFPCTVVIEKVTTLNHESLDYAMEYTVLVSNRLFILQELARA
jgi:hypothetical protein